MIVHTFIFSKNIFEVYYCWYFHNILHKWIYTQTKHFTWLIVVYWDSVRRKYLMYTQIHDPSSTLYCIHCIEQWIRDLSIELKIKLVGKFQIKWKLESYVFHWHTPLEGYYRNIIQSFILHEPSQSQTLQNPKLWLHDSPIPNTYTI